MICLKYDQNSDDVITKKLKDILMTNLFNSNKNITSTTFSPASDIKHLEFSLNLKNR